MSNYQTYSKAIVGKDLPLAFIDMDMLEKNISEIVKRANGTRIRIATKSLRCRKIQEFILEQKGISGSLCFTVAEAVWLSQNGHDDLLVAYPSTNKNAIETACNELKKGKKLMLMVDLKEHAEIINDIAAKNGIVFPVCLDLDMSSQFPGVHFGVYRSSIRSLKDLKKRVAELKEFNNIQISGAMGYEAQIAGVGDQVPGKFLTNKIVRSLKRKSIKEVTIRRGEMVEWLQHNGINLEIVNGGGTGSIESTVSEPWVNEVTVGSGFFNSGLFDNYKDFQHHPAAGFALSISRHSEKGILTCFGGGYIASGKPGWDKLPTPYLPEGMEYIKNEGAGEVQTPLLNKSGLVLQIGDPVFFRHAKAGELSERFSHYFLLRNGKIVDEIPTYRGENQTFL